MEGWGTGDKTGASCCLGVASVLGVKVAAEARAMVQQRVGAAESEGKVGAGQQEGHGRGGDRVQAEWAVVRGWAEGEGVVTRSE